MRSDFVIAGCRASPSLRTITVSDTVHQVEPKVMDVLVCLAEHAGEVVTKDELIQAVWGATAVTDHSLVRCVAELRRVLGDDARQPTFIQTVSKSGYRLTAPVEWQDVRRGDAAASEERSTPLVAVPSRAHVRSRAWVASLALGIVTIGSIYFLAVRVRPAPSTEATGKVWLLVLPFENLTGNAEQEFVSDGLTDEIITRTGGLSPVRLGVIARTSSKALKGRKSSIDELGRQFGVQYVLEGTVKRWQERAQVNIAMIRVADASRVWTKEFDFDVRHVIGFEREVAEAVAGEIRLRLAPDSNASYESEPRIDPEAFESYLSGRFWAEATGGGLQPAGFFQTAIAKAPRFAPAYAGLADQYTRRLRNLSGSGRHQLLAETRMLVAKALELDDSSAEAHTSLGVIRMMFDWDWAAAQREFQRALELNAAYGPAHYHYATLFSILGQHDRAVKESEAALRVDPLSTRAHILLAEKFIFARRHDEAHAPLQRARQLSPQAIGVQANFVNLYSSQGKYAEAGPEVERLRRMVGGDRLAAFIDAYFDALGGNRSRALDAIRIFNELVQQGTMGVEYYPVLLNLAGDTDRAFEVLDVLVAERTIGSILFARMPDLDSLRSDPRFKALMVRANLPLD